jgi:hypothetical protein
MGIRQRAEHLRSMAFVVAIALAASLGLACSGGVESAVQVSQPGVLTAEVDRLLGVQLLDVRGAMAQHAARHKVRGAHLEMMVAGNGGVRGELRIGERVYVDSAPAVAGWQAVVAIVFEAHALAVRRAGDADAVAELLRSNKQVSQIAGRALLADADQRSFDLLLQGVGMQAPPSDVRELAGLLVRTPGPLPALSLIRLCQRYPGQRDELLGAVGERREPAARGFLTAVAMGHENASARDTALAALEALSR